VSRTEKRENESNVASERKKALVKMDFHPKLEPILQYGEPFALPVECDNVKCHGDKADEEEKALMVQGKRMSRTPYVRVGGKEGYDPDLTRVHWLENRLSVPNCHHQHLRGSAVILESIAPQLSYVDYEWGQVWGRKLLAQVLPEKLKNMTLQEHTYCLADTVTDHLKKREAKASGVCAIRSEIYAELFSELIRQLAIECPERGLLLLKIRALFENERQIWLTQCQSGMDGFTSRKLTELNVAVSSESDDPNMTTEEKMKLRIKEKFDAKEAMLREVNHWKGIYDTKNKKQKYQMDEFLAGLKGDKETIEKENNYIVGLKETVRRESTYNPFDR